MVRLWLCLIALFLFSQPASAADYYWFVSGKPAAHYPSAMSACSSQDFTETAAHGGNTFTAYGVNLSDPRNGVCLVRVTRKDGTTYTGNYYSIVSRLGDSCPVNTEYNTTTGACDSIVDPCESTSGQTVMHEHQVGTLDNLGSPNSEPPFSICENGCQAAWGAAAATTCYRYVDGSNLNAAFCKYAYKYNGVSCTTDNPQPGNIFDQPPTKPPTPLDPTYTDNNTCDSWVTNADGSRSRNCTANAEYKDPGRLDCQNGSGTLVCSSGSPSPKYNGQETDIQTDETSHPDGSKNTTTTTTTTTTTCKGAEPCVTTTKTETQGEETNADGTPGDETSDCVGTGCNPADANQDGKPDDEEEEEEERLASTGACDMPATCSGDAIDCAVLQEEKTQRCLAEENSDYSKHKDEVEGQLGADKYQLDSETVTVPSLLDGSTRFLPSSCPQPSTVSLTSGTSLSFDYSPFCSFASGLAPVVVALALLFGAIYVGRAFGG